MPRVLVVEDEADIRELLRYNLEQEGFGVEEARRRRRGATIRFAGARPTPLLLDLMLPGMSGLELCQQLRLEPADRAPCRS